VKRRLEAKKERERNRRGKEKEEGEEKCVKIRKGE
jgi:hypothetical protein